MKNRSIGFVSLIILAIVISTLIPTKQAEPEAPVKFRPIVSIQISFPLPNVEYCYMCIENKANAKVVIDSCLGIKEHIDELEFPTVDVILTSLGNYYVTGYTSLECGGSTMTASGATVHKDDSSLTNPTTCAIDPALHDFGDVFYVESFGFYIAEDTGSAVKGKHLDLYFHDDEYSVALAMTGYYEVFAVEYVYGTVPASNYDIMSIIANIRSLNMEDLYSATIPLNPKTKKNNQEILKNRTTGKYFVAQSKAYKQYERDCGWFLKKPASPISSAVNVKCIFYRDSERRVDLTNLLEAIDDILVKYGVLADDNFKIIVSHDGSRVFVDRKNPRTEITIYGITGDAE